MRKGKRCKVRLLDGRSAALLLLSALFAVGGAAGCAAANISAGRSGDALLAFLNGWLELVNRGQLSCGFFDILWQTLRFPLGVFLLGLTAFGVAGLPLAFLVRGFALGYAAGVFYALLAGRGLALALCLFGCTAVVWLPAALYLGVCGMTSAYGLARRACGDGHYPVGVGRSWPGRCALCLACACLCACMEYALVPLLLRLFCV